MRNRLAVLSAVLAFAVLVGGLAVFAARSGDGDLPRLPIGATGERGSAGTALGAGARAGSSAGAATADMALYPYRLVEYRIGARLPDVGDHAAAYRWSAPTEAGVKRLAGRLGVVGAVKRQDGAWTVSNGTRFLRVDERSGQWNVGPDPSTPVSSSAVAVGKCAPCPPDRMCAELVCEQPMRPAGMPSQAEAERLARAFWDKAGIDVGQAKVEVDDGFTQWYVRFRPLLGGRPVIGAETSVAIGDKGAVEWANGWIADPDKLGDYPLVSPEKAVARLNASMKGGGVDCGAPNVLCDPGPKPMPAEKPSCRSGWPTTVSWPEGACIEEDTPTTTIPNGGTGGAGSAGSAGSSGSGSGSGSTGGGSTGSGSVGPPDTTIPSDDPKTGTTPVAPPEPTVLTITGVRVELQAVGEYVVPVYVFTLQDGGETGPVLAVPDQYLATVARDGGQPAQDMPGVPEPAPR